MRIVNLWVFCNSYYLILHFITFWPWPICEQFVIFIIFYYYNIWQHYYNFLRNCILLSHILKVKGFWCILLMDLFLKWIIFFMKRFRIDLQSLQHMVLITWNIFQHFHKWELSLLIYNSRQNAVTYILYLGCYFIMNMSTVI